MEADWINLPKPRVTGAMLATNVYNGKVVTVLGKITGSIDPTGKYLHIQTTDNVKLQIRFPQPLMEPLTGYLDINGRVTNKTEILCLNYVTLNEDMMKNFDGDLFNRAVDIYDRNVQKRV